MKIALIGYGKMGKEIESVLTSRGHTVGAVITRDNTIDKNLNIIKTCDVAIEFTTPEATLGNLLQLFQAGIPVVCGTTGWYKDFNFVKKKQEEFKGGLLYATNFSVGVQIFFEINRRLAELMRGRENYTVSLEETHHIHKKDKPSGTALTLSEDILQFRDKLTGIKLIEGEDNFKTDLNQAFLPLICKREAEVPGTHSVVYNSQEDSITISHEAFNRRGFALGAVLAAEFLMRKTGIFTMKDILL